jgi:hypothetical protein
MPAASHTPAARLRTPWQMFPKLTRKCFQCRRFLRELESALSVADCPAPRRWEFKVRQTPGAGRAPMARVADIIEHNLRPRGEACAPRCAQQQRFSPRAKRSLAAINPCARQLRRHPDHTDRPNQLRFISCAYASGKSHCSNRLRRCHGAHPEATGFLRCRILMLQSSRPANDPIARVLVRSSLSHVAPDNNELPVSPRHDDDAGSQNPL